MTTRPDLRHRLRHVIRRARVEPLYDRAIATARRVKHAPEDVRWRRSIGAILTNGVAVRTGGAWSSTETGTVPLVMCLWNRPQRINHVLDMLASLDGVSVRLLLWNNNHADADVYDRAIRDAVRGSIASIDLFHSPRNVGGLARFLATRLLVNGGYEGPVAFLDDDQDVTPTFLSDLLRDYTERSVVAWWGFSLHGSYWRRAEIEPGSPADHAGTGGTVLDASLVRDDRFFSRLPRRFAFVEDQWMTFVAHAAGWRVIKGRTHIDLVLEETNQYHGLLPLKDEFYVFARDRGERLMRRPSRHPAWNRGRLRGSEPTRAGRARLTPRDRPRARRVFSVIGAAHPHRAERAEAGGSCGDSGAPPQRHPVRGRSQPDALIRAAERHLTPGSRGAPNRHRRASRPPPMLDPDTGGNPLKKTFALSVAPAITIVALLTGMTPVSAAPLVTAPAAGSASLLAAATPTDRFAGADRFEVAVAISRSSLPGCPSCTSPEVRTTRMP